MDYKWLNKHSRLFLERGYLPDGVTPEARIRAIAETAESYLQLPGFADKFEGYMKRGFYSLSTPVWTNFGNSRGLPVSCVSEDSWINTIDGGKMAKDIQIGDEVLTHKGRYRRVTDVIPTNNKDDIYILKVGTRLTPIKITGNHLVKTNAGWTRVDELDKNKHLVAVNGDIENHIGEDYSIDLTEFSYSTYENDDGFLKKRINKKNQRRTGRTYSEYHSEPRTNIPVDDELCWALGLWFAEGSLSTRRGKPSGIRITLGSDEKEEAKKWHDIISKKFNLNGNISENLITRNGKTNSWINVNINSNIIGSFFQSFGNGCKTKTMPSWMMNLPPSKKREILNGLLFGDGCLRNNCNKITLSNPRLILQVYKIGLELGMEMSLQMQEKAGKLSSSKYVYTIIFRNYENSTNRNRSCSGIKFEDGLVYCPIISLDKTDLVKNVYDFTVEEDHSFSVSGVVVHNCFGSLISDTIDSILGKTCEVGKMSKMGGGTSGFFGDLRPRGAPISVGGESSGPVHFMELFDTVAEVISQGSQRRGSFAAYLPIDHPDIEEFLLIRSDGHPIQNMSIGVTISDEWMNGLVAGDKDKRKIWGKVIQKRFETGYPYIFFSDTVNNNAPQVYKDKGLKIKASNLCVAPETLILTKNGHEIIANLENEECEVWNGNQWSKVTVIKTGENQKLLKVTLSDGKSLECTPYHKWYVVDSYRSWSKGLYSEKKTEDLKVGDRLIKFNAPVIDGSVVFKYPYAHGAFCGDGTYEQSGAPRLPLYGEKDKVVPYLDCEFRNRGRDASGRLNIILTRDLPKKFEVPLNSPVQTKLRWLEGYLDMDGTIARNGTNESIQVVSVEHKFLEDVQLLLQTLGVNSKIVSGSEAGYKLMPDGRGGSKEYFCKTSKRLLITSNGLYQLSLLGFSPKRLIFDQRLPQREAMQFVKVESVVDESRYDDTYCVNEPLEHKAVFNGILTGNCSEINLSSDENNSFVCVLSSLNLVHWDEMIKTDAIETLIYFLDVVNTEFIDKTSDMPFMATANNFAKTQRALGMGVLGWHSLLQSKLIPFESMEAKLLNNSIWKTIRERADKATEKLAELFGEPELLKGYGRRNVTTLAVAPTTSSSFILGQVSPSIEPENSCYYVKKLAKGSFTYKNPYLSKILKDLGKDTDDVWKSILLKGGSVQHLDFLTQEQKDVFKTFGEISQKEIVIQAAQRQKYIDQSQSLNLMVPPDVSPKEVSQLLIEGWKLGVKTFYYQRSANPVQQLSRSIMTCTSCEG